MRSPMAQPPGWYTDTCPNLASNGPIKKMEERICFIRSSGTSYDRMDDVSIVTVPCSCRHVHPSRSRIYSITSMSSKCGTLCSVTSPSANKLAAIIGKAAFFAPWMRMDPERGFPPSITNLSNVSPPGFTAHPLRRLPVPG
ncbi:hypothetical protein D3C76_1477190 [compost metagenome]